MPNQGVTTHTDLILHTEVHDCCAAVERYSHIRTAGLGLNHSCIRLGFVFTLYAIVILDDVCCDCRVPDGTAIENITNTEVICKLILQTLFSCSSVYGLCALFTGDFYVIESKIICAFGGNSQPEFIAVLGCSIVGRKGCPFSRLYCLGIQFHNGLFIGFFVQAKQRQVENFIRLAEHLHTVVIILAANQIEALSGACTICYAGSAGYHHSTGLVYTHPILCRQLNCISIAAPTIIVGLKFVADVLCGIGFIRHRRQIGQNPCAAEHCRHSGGKFFNFHRLSSPVKITNNFFGYVIFFIDYTKCIVIRQWIFMLKLCQFRAKCSECHNYIDRM